MNIIPVRIIEYEQKASIRRPHPNTVQRPHFQSAVLGPSRKELMPQTQLNPLCVCFALGPLGLLKTKNKTHPFKTRDLHRFKRCRIEHHRGSKFKYIAKELI